MPLLLLPHLDVLLRRVLALLACDLAVGRGRIGRVQWLIEWLPEPLHGELLNRAGGATWTGHRRQQRRRRFAGHDLVGNRVGMLLVCVADLADAALELYAGALLNDVHGLVGGGVQIWGAGKRNGVPRRVRSRAYVARGLAGVAADMRLDPVDRVGMVRPEAGGDAIAVR